ncbi:hypothetical protein A1O1_03752 [Capronia coronata CBS 617.96]|uniref:RING-type domain-containing protein n=1 Tax=Capronia coronata CBS 617.96 TaxID=1182541 RepID=W9YDM8_9EURO|nr:uncharacterized protein A1O1_03752 [Capronia coronata CBS 617.96]EXJ90648.1 hypothetical protein A1O1_03752 [Capronia coronata CBS 617.96]
MYIPKEQISLQTPSPARSSPLPPPPADSFPGIAASALYRHFSRAAVPTNETVTTHDSGPVIASTTFISVTVTCLCLFVLIFGFSLYKRCIGRVDQSETSSISSASAPSAWHVDGTDFVTGEDVAKRHRKRLRKLDHVAPSKSLHDWRSEKTTMHVQTFASVSKEKDLVRELQCGHVYHTNCLNLWVERGHHDCPLCKFDILGLKKNPVKVQDADLERGEAAELEQGSEPEQGQRTILVQGSVSTAGPDEATPQPALQPVSSHDASDEPPRNG